MEFYASCPAAFEQALARELRDLGARRVRPLKGRVSFEGDPRDAYRACLWSHLASRVHVVLARFSCGTADELYRGVRELPWQDILRPGASIAVSSHGTNQELRNTRYSTLCVKDAIVDAMLEAIGARPDVNVHAPDARLALTIRANRASLSLDLSGEPLFKRIPRAVLACAPKEVDILRPDYAALILAEGSWPELCRQAREASIEPPLLVDLACADGGVLLEAAQWLQDRAPGIARTRWGFQGWAQHDPRVWRELLAEARDRAEAGRKRAGRIIATDADGQAFAAARRVASAAQPACDITFVKPTTDAIHDALGRHAQEGLVVADTSVMSTDAEASSLRFIGEASHVGACRSFRISLLTRSTGPTRMPGRGTAYSASITLGSDDMCLTVLAAEGAQAETPRSGIRGGKGAATASATGRIANATNAGPELRAAVDVGNGKPVPVLVPESEQFARRLIKVARQRRRWAMREGVSCYRVYDADLPDYAAAIDLYEGTERTPGRWLVIAEYAAPKSVDPALAQSRMQDILAIAPRVLDVPAEHVHAKIRQRSRGGSQYGRQHGGSRGIKGAAHASGDILVREGGLTFAVNFDEYLDTGIFLDHRLTRGLVRAKATDAESFLNLFAYTGTATCYAADGGASETVTVDLSNTYLDWAAYNMELNGFAGRQHRFVRDDVLSWIERQRHTANRWDLIFCDPPTFSNSTRMGERTFDVQRDHVELLENVVGLLARGGEAIFSCNLRSFKPDMEALEKDGIELTDISEQTIPEDFQRNKRIHRCYIARRA